MVTITRTPVDPTMLSARCSSALRYASKVGSPICVHRPSLTRSTVSQRPTISNATSGWSRLTCADHLAGQPSHSALCSRV
ncbi:Uncharacterised protein [Mycobacterium tuberculosis]|uniref:Uncharacterized protein n=1 Tax=Mycobacterium tuberculosis TaxID=1773 RepID=A0A0U0THG7_MYCTX|nr:Uncharacterised protein [Mycobacterium tuberculosis]COY88180.1 Uncharacterised protein [Mycobacterium tuberculosis]COZ72809.1 Uncharacterised protein [Mycobacterium tuberculosis]